MTKQDIFRKAHCQTREELDRYARCQGFTYAQTFRSVLSGIYSVINGYDGSFVR